MIDAYSGGGSALSVTVGTTPTRLFPLDRRLNYIRISNLSDNYVFISPTTSNNPKAEMYKGIALAPKGTPGWYLEFNSTNMFQCDFWAIAEADSDLAIFLGY
jgi:hypothetical protein